MKNLRFLNSILLLFLLFISTACVKECLDIPKLDEYTQNVKEWVVDNTIGNQTISDENGISQTLIVSSIDSVSHDDITEDDCGNIYGCFDFSIQYKTSLSPLHFMIDIHTSSSLEDDFYLKLLITNTNQASEEHKSTTYNFYTKKSVENNATINYIEQMDVSNRTYHDVLEFIFNDTFSGNDVKTLYYAKRYGIIKFIKANGNTFELESNKNSAKKLSL